MEPLKISFTTDETFEAGDRADIKLNSVVIKSAIDLVPGAVVHPGHVEGGHLETPHLDADTSVGHLEHAHLLGGHLQGARLFEFETDDLYAGLYTVEVITRDRIGNAAEALSIDIFLNTGPRPPSDLHFVSQDGSGPITFGFTASPELV